MPIRKFTDKNPHDSRGELVAASEKRICDPPKGQLAESDPSEMAPETQSQGPETVSDGNDDTQPISEKRENVPSPESDPSEASSGTEDGHDWAIPVYHNAIKMPELLKLAKALGFTVPVGTTKQSLLNALNKDATERTEEHWKMLNSEFSTLPTAPISD